MAKPEVTDKPSGTIVSDPDEVAVTKIGRILKGLDENARARVLNWINSKFTAAYYESP